MATAEPSHQSNPRDEALEALHDVIEMCEKWLLDKDNMTVFILLLDRTEKVLENYRQQSPVDKDAEKALPIACARFMTQAGALETYFVRYYASSESSPADGLVFVEGFRSLQLKTLEQAYDLRQLLDK